MKTYNQEDDSSRQGVTVNPPIDPITGRIKFRRRRAHASKQMANNYYRQTIQNILRKEKKKAIVEIGVKKTQGYKFNFKKTKHMGSNKRK